MRTKIFPIFITILGLFTAFIFYVFWHTDEVNPPQTSSQPVNVKTPSNHFTPKKRILSTSLSIEELNMERKKDIKIASFDDKDTNVNNAPQLTEQEMQDKTQEVYASLTPDNYDEVQQEANDAFDAIDAHVSDMEEKAMHEDSIEETITRRMINEN